MRALRGERLPYVHVRVGLELGVHLPQEQLLPRRARNYQRVADEPQPLKSRDVSPLHPVVHDFARRRAVLPQPHRGVLGPSHEQVPVLRAVLPWQTLGHDADVTDLPAVEAALQRLGEGRSVYLSHVQLRGLDVHQHVALAVAQVAQLPLSVRSAAYLARNLVAVLLVVHVEQTGFETVRDVLARLIVEGALEEPLHDLV